MAAYWGGTSSGLLNTPVGGQEPQQTQFPRFNFGAGSSNWNPYMPQSYAQQAGGQSSGAPGSSGILSGNSPASIGGQPVAGGVYTGGSGPGGMIVDNLFGSGPPKSGPQASNAAFGTNPAPAGTTPQSWQNFKFANPTSAFQENYNYLQGINPELATAYGASPFHNQEFKTGIDAMQHGGQAFNPEGNSWGDSMGNALINAYNPNGGNNAITQSLGLPSGWQSQFNPQMLGMDPSGKTMTINGQTYTLPQADAAYAQPKLWWQK
jgi:hypothetical protein